MFGLQPTDILIIIIVALIFFGPKRLPDLAHSIGKSMKEFQSAMKEGAKSSSDEPAKPQDSESKSV